MSRTFMQTHDWETPAPQQPRQEGIFPELSDLDPDTLLMCDWCFGMGKDPDMADGIFSCPSCHGEGVRSRAEIEEER